MALVIRSAASLKPGIRLAQAISEYEAVLQDSEKAEFRSLRAGRPPDVSDVMAVTAAIDRNNSHRRSRRCFGPRLTNVLESVQQFSTIVDILVGGSQSLTASAIWGTVKMTLKITSSFASYFDNLSALFMSIGRSCPRYQEYGLLYPTSPRLQNSLCEYFCAVVVLCRKAILFIRKPIYTQLSSAVLKPFKTEFGPLEVQLKDLAHSLREEASLASKQELSVVRTTLEGKISCDIELTRQLHWQTKKMRLLDACTTYNHRAAWKRARKAGTSSWILDEPAYKRWLSESTSNVLWCTGKLDAGKTVITANLVEETMIKSSGALVSYFFCTHDDAESLKARTILGSLANQLLALLPPDIFHHIDTTSTGALDEDEIVYMLLKLLPECGTCFVILDGLDECVDSELGMLLESLQKMLRTGQCFHIFCSARADIYNKHQLTLQPQIKVSLPENNPEIAQYIDSALDDRLDAGTLSLGDPRIILNIRDALLEGSQGMSVLSYLAEQKLR